MPVRTAEAHWTGGLKDGRGWLQSQSNTVKGAYSYPTRFEGAQGTNPEELVAAAHAGCYAMALAACLDEEGHEAGQIDAEADVTLEEVDGTPTLSRIELNVSGTVPGIDGATFRRIAETAKDFCPVSRALAGVEITLNVEFGS